MKKIIYTLFGLFGLLWMKNAGAQYYYSYSIHDILAAGTGGLTLPNGVNITAQKVALGTGVCSSTMGNQGPQLGGVFDGYTNGGATDESNVHNSYSILPNDPPGGAYGIWGTCMGGYTGTRNSTMFTNISATPSTIANGKVATQNCRNTVGFLVHFSKPVPLDPFLVLDLDGDLSSNAEWEGAFAFNGSTYVNCAYSSSGLSGGVNAKMTSANISITGTNQTWPSWIQTNIGNTAYSNFPTTSFPIVHRTNASLATSDPDNVNTQVLYSPAGMVTDFVILWGVWDANSNSGTQNSGLSPIILNYPTPLPITITFYSVQNSGCNDVLVKWSITDAKNFSRFEVERATDGKNFNKVGEVAFNEKITSHSFIDKNLETGTYCKFHSN